MKISVIIPVYNASNTVEKSILSVLNQTYQGDLEIIAVNDGSRDNSLAILEKLELGLKNSRFSFFIVDQENGGVSKARNAGMRVSTGDFIALLDSDDEWHPEKLEKQIEIFLQGKNVDFLGCGRNNEELRIFGRKITSLHKATVKELLIKMFPQTSTAIFTRDVYMRNGGYNENMTHGEDGEFWIRICANSDFYYLPESLVVTGDGKPSFGHSGLSANLEAMQEGNEYIIKLALKNKLIGHGFYSFLLLFYRIKYYRRIIITQLR
ncbi:hypothetical protein ASG31_03825 [Chryseobacterium sp. Leaf404]|uniref:glycosyltransferase family 2 protein n=1 Tax=unclassified Chryseobacterium TaxID=2593645 RepID=UPI0006F61DA1|nr:MULTISPECIES: glycosyltransferase family A protein [unclassified Chryseobacterium]KQT17877.1 hypothetical protein ASG31_03825 [Chryseobacterium sp. Leaf404]